MLPGLRCGLAALDSASEASSKNAALGDGLFIFYRAFTLALIGVFFFPFVPLSQFAAQVVIAGAVGAVLGAVVGFAQLRLSKQQVRE
jgi:hypothetical protein